jgi:DNA-binding CsgD family transcriptional regulator
LSLAAARVLTAAGRFAPAEQHLAAAFAQLGGDAHANLRVAAVIYRAELELWQDRPAEALRHLEATPKLLDGGPADPYSAYVAALGVRAAADLRHTAASRRARAAADTPGERFIAWIGALPDLRGAPAETQAVYVVARAELTRVAGAPDPTAWAAAAAAWESFGCPYQRAYALWREAEALLRRRDRRAAQECVGTAAEIATELGALPLLRHIEALATRTRLALAGVSGSAPYGLTPRERDVLNLVAHGRTNREIAHSLFISEHTVSVHVSRILTKLGVGNRAAAAATAHRDGLA